jgi:glycerate dehydrogenase
MTNIVILDSHALNPGDLSWKALEALGSCRIYARTDPADIVSRSQSADVLLTNKTPLTADTLQQLPHLRYIGVLATGFDLIDTSAARSRGVPVTNIPQYGTRSVAQHTWSLILELAGRAGHHARTVRQGRWATNPDWCYWDGPLIELAGLTLGIIGRGRIGREAGHIGEAFGMSVRYATPADGPSGLADVLASSDFVSLHCPLTPATRNLINSRTLELMKPTAFLINTSRGQLIHEAHLADALHNNRLAGAALDVLAKEPPAIDNPLIGARNCLITPHLGWATTAARHRLLATAVANIEAYLRGAPENVVN